MNMDKRSLLAILLCVVFYVAYTQYLNTKYPDYGKNKIKSQTEQVVDSSSDNSESKNKESKNIEVLDGESGSASTASSTEEEAKEVVEKLSDKELKFETANAVYHFDQNLSALRSVKLKHYREERDSPEGEWMELLDAPLIIQGAFDITNVKGMAGFDAKRVGDTIEFSKKSQGWKVTQKFTVPKDGYYLDIDLAIQNISNAPKELTGGLLFKGALHFSKDDEGGFLNFVRQRKTFIHGIEGSRDSEDAKGFCDDSDKSELEDFRLASEKFDFIGIDLHYFLMVLKPEVQNGKMDSYLAKSGQSVAGYCPVSLFTYQKSGLMQPGATTSLKYHAYLGPKDVTVLENHEESMVDTIDFGMFGFIARPLLAAIQILYDFVGNYGIAIIIMTSILKLLFYPLTKAAAVSMKTMQKLQPQMNQIKEKFKDNPQKQQMEIMAFMKKNKVNPAKGCFPILPQIPVFIAFYNVLSQAIELRHAPFYGWILDLSSRDPYFVSPLLLGVGMFVQQKLTPNPSMDKSQQRIMMMMPIIFTTMMLSMPSGMVLYMLTNTIISIAQQQWLNRKLDKLLVTPSAS